MSDLQRSFAKAKLANLPFNPPRPLNDIADDDGVVAAAAAESNKNHTEGGHDGDANNHGASVNNINMETTGTSRRHAQSQVHDPATPPAPTAAAGFDSSESAEASDSLRPLPSSPTTAINTTTITTGAPGLEDDSSSASSASSVSSTGTVIPSPSQRLFARGKAPSKSTSRFSPLPWTDFFAQELFLTTDDKAKITHHVYATPPASSAGPIFLMHHGAGSAAMTFATVVAELAQQVPGAGFLAPDARGHGETTIGIPSAVTVDGTLDLSLNSLCRDLERVWVAARDKLGWSETTPVIMVGHSLGGAVVATVAHDGKLSARLLGFAVIDVVEGSAMEGLQNMMAYLATRPRSFATVEEGIEWHLRSRTLRNTYSARASVPALLRPESPPSFPRLPAARSSVSQQPGGQSSVVSQPQHENLESDPDDGTATQRWIWRTELESTQLFWQNWFSGMSSKFLTAKGAKLLLLAGTDRLDKELMIGQMQGKYQMQVFPEAGHFVQEDLPAKTALVLADFWTRNDGSRMVLPPKVSELLAQGKLV